MHDILGFTLEELQEKLREEKIKPFVARQIFQWVCDRANADIGQWTNISLANRAWLGGHLRPTSLQVLEITRSSDGTRKLLIGLADGERIESVLIPEKGHATFCLSTQVGCPLGCRFCATGRLGWKRNLTAAEILGQVFLLKLALDRGASTINLVFMGMGEPLLNYDHLARSLQAITAPWGFHISPRHVTVSTAGILSGIERLEREFPLVKIALSVGAPDAALREELMPHSRAHPLAPILSYFRRGRRKHRITFEYVLIAGITDAPAQARKLATLIRGIPAKVNLIPYNESPGCDLRAPGEEAVTRFQELLADLGHTVIVRWSKGRDIRSACGQLAAGTSIDSTKKT